jgi:hypothetical protein
VGETMRRAKVAGVTSWAAVEGLIGTSAPPKSPAWKTQRTPASRAATPAALRSPWRVTREGSVHRATCAQYRRPPFSPIASMLSRSAVCGETVHAELRRVGGVRPARSCVRAAPSRRVRVAIIRLGPRRPSLSIQLAREYLDGEACHHDEAAVFVARAPKDAAAAAA